MKLLTGIIVLIVCTVSCKKTNERDCFKSFGAPVEKEFPLDSVSEFRLYKNITYHVFQDTLRKVVIKGGKNVIDFVSVNTAGEIISITNENKCNFLRDFENQITVEIHYPFYRNIYSETNDSLIFHDTICGEQIHVEQVQGGGGVRLCVNAVHLVMVSSHGVGSYTVSGHAEYADLRVQTNGSGNATGLKCPLYTLDHNSTGNLLINLDSAKAAVYIRGTGNVIYTGTPDSLWVTKTGDGTVIQN